MLWANKKKANLLSDDITKNVAAVAVVFVVGAVVSVAISLLSSRAGVCVRVCYNACVFVSRCALCWQLVEKFNCTHATHSTHTHTAAGRSREQSWSSTERTARSVCFCFVPFAFCYATLAALFFLDPNYSHRSTCLLL